MKQIDNTKITVRIYRASEGNLSREIFLLGDYEVRPRLIELEGRIITPFGNGTASPYFVPSTYTKWVTTIEGRDYIIQGNASTPPRIVIEPTPLSDEGLTFPPKEYVHDFDIVASVKSIREFKDVDASKLRDALRKRVDSLSDTELREAVGHIQTIED